MIPVSRVTLDIDSRRFDDGVLLDHLERLLQRASFGLNLVFRFRDGTVELLPDFLALADDVGESGFEPSISLSVPFSSLRQVRRSVAGRALLLVLLDFPDHIPTPQLTLPLPYVYRILLKRGQVRQSLTVAYRLLAKGGGYVFLYLSPALFHRCSKDQLELLTQLYKQNSARFWFNDDFLHTYFERWNTARIDLPELRRVISQSPKYKILCRRTVRTVPDDGSERWIGHLSECSLCKARLEAIWKGVHG